MYWRIFAAGSAPVEPAEILTRLNAAGVPASGRFKGDDLGWTAGSLTLPDEESPIAVERFLTDEDGIRGELNTWAAWLEAADYAANHRDLMGRVNRTRQLVTLRRPVDHADEATLDKLCEAFCRLIAERADGIYQADGGGFFAADGSLLLPEY